MTNTNGQHHVTDEKLSYLVIKAFFRVYNRLGSGFLEHVYMRALEIELRRMGLRVAREFSVWLYYDGVELCQYRLDMVVNDRLVVEGKSSYGLPRIAPRLVHNQLRATTLEVGLLLHFGAEPQFFRIFAPNKHKQHGARGPISRNHL